MRNLFISDLHLEIQKDNLITKFFGFLDRLQKDDNLYVLGDLFDFWLGDDDLSPFNLLIIDKLNSTTKRGVKISIIHGNHDFLLGSKFSILSNCKILGERAQIVIANSNILIMHGDNLCVKDKKFQIFRKIIYAKIFKKIFLALPLLLRAKIVEKTLQKINKMRSQIKSEDISIVSKSIVAEISLCSADFLIHGHLHKQYIRKIPQRNMKSYEISLGAWENKYSIFVIEKDKSDNIRFHFINNFKEI